MRLCVRAGVCKVNVFGSQSVDDQKVNLTLIPRTYSALGKKKNRDTRNHTRTYTRTHTHTSDRKLSLRIAKRR